MDRRQYLAATAIAATTGVAGCSGGGSNQDDPASDLVHSGTAADTVQHKIEMSTGETLRIEAENAEGPLSSIVVMDPDGERVVQRDVETESTVTHTAEISGVFRVIINTGGSTPYEIYRDGGDSGEGGDSDAPEEPASEPVDSGNTSGSVDHNVEVEEGETIRVLAKNREGARTTVTIVNPDGDMVLQERVETEATVTHTASSAGVFRVIINPTGSSSYEIYVDAGE